MAGQALREDEKEYIRLHCLTMSDEKIAKNLNRDLRTVVSYRRRIGIQKKMGGGVKDLALLTNTGTPAGEIVPASYGMSESIRKEFYKTQFTNSLYYANLKEQFSKEEIDFYLEEWSSLCLQFEDIVATEKRQIDEYIKLSILQNRILRNIYTIELEIKKLQEEIEIFRKAHDMENDPEAQERDTLLVNLVHTMNAQAKSIATDNEKTIAMKNRLLDELNARRKDRVDQLSKRGTTFLGFIQEFQDKKVREKQGRHMELVKMAKEKKKNEWRKPHRFPDETKDCILLDEESVLPEPDVVIINNNCRSIDCVLKHPNPKILVIDDESRRQQFFGDVFKNKQVEFVSNNELAIKSLSENTYDLVCLDYDLSLGDKSSKVAEKIVEGDLCKNTKILIHSMNKDGSKQLAEKLSSREVEIYPFEDIVKNLGESYAKNSISSGENQSNTSDEAKG